MGLDKELELSIQQLVSEIETEAKKGNFDLDVAVDHFIGVFNEELDFSFAPDYFIGGSYNCLFNAAKETEGKGKIYFLVEAAKLWGYFYYSSFNNKSAHEELRNIFSQLGKHAADCRHSQPGGSRDKRENICAIWASGKYSSRDLCAEQECAALGMSFSVARKALRNTPDPA